MNKFICNTAAIRNFYTNFYSWISFLLQASNLNFEMHELVNPLPNPAEISRNCQLHHLKTFKMGSPTHHTDLTCNATPKIQIPSTINYTLHSTIPPRLNNLTTINQSPTQVPSRSSRDRPSCLLGQESRKMEKSRVPAAGGAARLRNELVSVSARENFPAWREFVKLIVSALGIPGRARSRESPAARLSIKKLDKRGRGLPSPCLG